MNVRTVVFGWVAIAVCSFAVAQGTTANNARYRTVASGTNSTELASKVAHVTDSVGMENYSKICRISKPIVDFTKDRVVIVFLGQRTTGGYTAAVRGMTVNNYAAVIDVVETTPARDGGVTQALTSPWVMIAVDRTVLEFTARVTKVQANSYGSGNGDFGGWNPCGWRPRCNGYFDSFRNPYGQVFYSQSQLESWQQTSGFSFGSAGFSFNFSQSAFAIVSIGRLSQGYSCVVENVSSNRFGAAKVMVRRSRSATAPQRGVPWFGIELGRDIRQVTTEYFDDSSLVLVHRGDAVAQPNLIGRLISASQSGLRADQIRDFDSSRENLFAVTVAPNRRSGYKFEGIGYRGSQAVAMFSRPTTNPGSKAETYFVRVPKNIQTMSVEDLPGPSSANR